MLAGRYEFWNPPNDYLRVWEVEASYGTLTLIMRLKDGPAIYSLVHTGKLTINESQESYQFNFKIREWPSMEIRFMASKGQVRELDVLEEKGGEWLAATAFPKR